MARSDFGSSGFGVPPAEAVAGAVFYDQRDREGQDRRRRQTEQPPHSRLIDLLFDEIGPTGEKREKSPGRRRRTSGRGRQPVVQSAGQPLPETDRRLVPPPATESEEVVDRRVSLAAEEDEEETLFNEKIREARHISAQLRYCLSQHTETARKVSVYLQALLMVTHADHRPRLVIEV